VGHALSGSLGRPQQRRTDKGRKPDVGKIVVCTMLSVDGYTEGPGGDVMAMPMDAALSTTPTGLGRRQRGAQLRVGRVAALAG
jgi:hypothetical protein